jgi:SNF2 family DNA or RNA helicase
MAVKKHVYPKPTNLQDIEKIRKSKEVTLKPSPFVKETTVLRPYQTVGALNFLLLKYFILGDDPGLGKTVQALVAYAIAKQYNPKLQMIVFTIKSAKNQWASEVEKFLQGVTCHVLTMSYKPKSGGKTLTGLEARKAQYEDHKDTDIIVSGYYPLKTEPRLLRSSRGEDLQVVFDECQMLKNQKSKTHVGAELFIENATNIYGLTATPIKNRLTEFYYIYRIVMPKLMPKITHFKEQFCIEVLKDLTIRGGTRKVKEVVGYKNLEEFSAVISPYFFRRSADEVGGELPSIISKRVIFEMSPAQKTLYRQTVAGLVYQKRVKQKYFEAKEAVEQLELEGKEAPQKLLSTYGSLDEKYQEILKGTFLKNNKNASLAFCQLVANGPQWLGADEAGSSAKEDTFEEMMEGDLSGQKVIVYSRFKSGIPRLEAICKRLGVRCTRVTGSENDKERTEAMRVFQDKESGVDIIFITDAGSAAINLQVSGILVLYDTPWTWGDLVQVIGRARRLNSEHATVRVYHMISKDTIDERVLVVLEGKKALINKAVGKQAQGILEFGDKDSNKPQIVKEDLRSEVDILFEEVFNL